MNMISTQMMQLTGPAEIVAEATEKGAAWLPGLQDGALLAGLLVGGFIANFVARRILRRLAGRVVSFSQNAWDDAFVEHGVFERLSHLVPALILYWGAPWFQSETAGMWVQRVAVAYLTFTGIWSLNAMINAMSDAYTRSTRSQGKPIKGYVQTLKIFLYIVAVILILATLMDRSPWKLLSGIGALSAILLLVFKDSILGLVASIQISAYEMVRRGDWIEMPKFGADGDVIDVTLHTIKVQNWDKTITTIPTQSLINDSFKNWRGMSESGGRRIKRALSIDMNSVTFCTEEMLDRYEKLEHVGEYIRERRKEVDDYNQERKVDRSSLANGRALTNLGCFRAYVLGYLRDHPKIREDMTLLVRQLEPKKDGIPMQIYCFTTDTAWAVYEGIQSDIFDHLLAAIQEFDLSVFQEPAGRDVMTMQGGVV